MRTYTKEELSQMSYQKELMPLYRQLVQSGLLTKSQSMKRENIESRVYKAIGREKSYHASIDVGMLRARVKVCEQQLEASQRYIQELESRFERKHHSV